MGAPFFCADSAHYSEHSGGDDQGLATKEGHRAECTDNSGGMAASRGAEYPLAVTANLRVAVEFAAIKPRWGGDLFARDW